MQTKKNMEIYKQNMKKRISYINKIISGHIYSHTIKITNFSATNSTLFIYPLYRVITDNCSQDILAEFCNLSLL